MTVGIDGIERDPVRLGKCYACAYEFHLWVCPTCEGPYIESACKICHDERRHGVITAPKGASGARHPALHMDARSARTTATGEAFCETSRGWKGGEAKSSRRPHR